MMLGLRLDLDSCLHHVLQHLLTHYVLRDMLHLELLELFKLHFVLLVLAVGRGMLFALVSLGSLSLVLLMHQMVHVRLLLHYGFVEDQTSGLVVINLQVGLLDHAHL